MGRADQAEHTFKIRMVVFTAQTSGQFTCSLTGSKISKSRKCSLPRFVGDIGHRRRSMVERLLDLGEFLSLPATVRGNDFQLNPIRLRLNRLAHWMVTRCAVADSMANHADPIDSRPL